MKKFLLFICFLLAISVQAQTTAPTPSQTEQTRWRSAYDSLERQQTEAEQAGAQAVLQQVYGYSEEQLRDSCAKHGWDYDVLDEEGKVHGRIQGIGLDGQPVYVYNNDAGNSSRMGATALYPRVDVKMYQNHQPENLERQNDWEKFLENYEIIPNWGSLTEPLKIPGYNGSTLPNKALSIVEGIGVPNTSVLFQGMQVSGDAEEAPHATAVASVMLYPLQPVTATAEAKHALGVLYGMPHRHVQAMTNTYLLDQLKSVTDPTLADLAPLLSNHSYGFFIFEKVKTAVNTYQVYVPVHFVNQQKNLALLVPANIHLEFLSAYYPRLRIRDIRV
jgi:hypothetical protein